jgi:hypothetical protein
MLMIDIQIDRIHCSAVREEIGEKLAVALGPRSDVLPARLLELMDRLAKIEPSPDAFRSSTRDLKAWKISRMRLSRLTPSKSWPWQWMPRSLLFRIRPVQNMFNWLETILRTAKDGERDPKALERMALLEFKISPRL